MIHLYKDFYLTADSLQFILFQKKIIDKGVHKGEEYMANKKYFPSIKLLLMSLFNQSVMAELKDDDVQSLQDLKKRYFQLSVHLRKISDEIGSTKNLLQKAKSDAIEE